MWIRYTLFRHGGYGFPFKQWYVSWTQRSINCAIKRCQALIYEETEGSMTMSLRECLDKGGWNRTGAMNEAIDYFMFDFEHGATAEKMSAWQSSFTGIGINSMEEKRNVLIFRNLDFQIFRFLGLFRLVPLFYHSVFSWLVSAYPNSCK